MKAMGKRDTADLQRFLKPFPKDMQQLALWLRGFIWDAYPTANELIYDNYNALAVGWSPTDRVGHTFCSIALGRSSGNVHFGFYSGSTLSDPRKLLLGEGNQYRYILVKNREEFPRAYIIRLMKEAYQNSLAKVKDKSQLRERATLTKSVSKAKREPGKAFKTKQAAKQKRN